MYYRRFCKTLIGNGILLPENEDIYKRINEDTDYYLSVFKYNEDHYKHFLQKSTIAGITDVITNSIYFDFDSEQNVLLAKQDTTEVVNSLIGKGLTLDCIKIFFSGNKGFAVEVETTSEFTPNEVKNICSVIAKGLKTFDTTMYNASRIWRLPFTRNQKSGLYKIPLTLQQLNELSVDQIVSMSKNIQDIEPIDTTVAELPKAIIMLKDKVPETTTELDVSDLSVSHRPKGFPACKWAIQNGFIPKGLSSNCLMALAAHYKAQGFNQDTTYGVLKSAVRLRKARYPETNDITKDYIWNNIIGVVYGESWQGKTYSCRDHEFLKKVCPVLNTDKCSIHKTDKTVVTIEDMDKSFHDFASNLEQNIIKTGIKTLDDNLMITTSMPVGLLGAPSSGKTSMMLNILQNTSKQGIKSICASLDMGMPLMYARIGGKLTGKTYKEFIHAYKHKDMVLINKFRDLYKENFNNVAFTYKSAQSVETLRQTVLDKQQETGDKIRLVVIDYLECLTGPYSDATANSGFIANQLKDLANELELCVLTLVQPQKHVGDPSVPILTYRNIKGASILEQCFRVIVSVHREGFSPVNPDDDRFLTINVLKNTMGSLSSHDFYWSGVRGDISTLDEQGYRELRRLREKLAETKSKSTSEMF